VFLGSCATSVPPARLAAHSGERYRALSFRPGARPSSDRYPAGMDSDLRSCPFCDSSNLMIVRASDGDLATIAVLCLECGATGPKGTRDDPPQHVRFMWNQRQGRVQ
jgi:hypothetical protein